MKQIKKKDLKEVIRLTKKWCEAIVGDDEVIYQELCQARLKAFGNKYTPYNHVVLSVLLLKSKTKLNTFYKIFEVLGCKLL